MTKLLLDYRWALEDALDNPEVSSTLREFVRLLRRTGLDPAPFVEDQQLPEMWKRLEGGNHRKRNWDQINEFLGLCRRGEGGTCRATLSPEPPGILDNWRRALRDQLSDPSAWRSPQIVVPKSRLSEWESHKGEIAIQCEACHDQPASGPHHRILACLSPDLYESHQFTVSDLDPWDLQRIHPPISNRPRQHPALLPKPQLLISCPLQNLHEQLQSVCAYQWEINGKYYFIPPKDFDPLGIDKDTWRKGRAFRYETAPGSDKSGPVDYKGRVWSWDEHERHWDVQTQPRHMRISHTGRRLPDHN